MINKIKHTVNKLIEVSGSRDPFKICKDLNIWIYIVPLGNIKINYLYTKGQKAIFINKDLSKEDMKKYCAIELGYITLHSYNGKLLKPKDEEEKVMFEEDLRAFALELLLCDSY